MLGIWNSMERPWFLFPATVDPTNRPDRLRRSHCVKDSRRIGSSIWIILQVTKKLCINFEWTLKYLDIESGAISINRSHTIRNGHLLIVTLLIDPFAVDFDEELSALFGGVLDDQSIYLELCIKAVLNLYKNLSNPPTSVSIVSHSMVTN